jgi:hypothetical protein
MVEPSADQAVPPDADTEAKLKGFERKFRRAGLPLFIEDFSASTDVYNRALPVLILVVIGEVLGAISLDWSFIGNVAALFGALAILLGALGGMNLLRARRFAAPIDDIGKPELAAFVIVPALLPLVFGGQWLSALVTAGANLALLGVIYAVIAYGLFSILRWVAGRLANRSRPRSRS